MASTGPAGYSGTPLPKKLGIGGATVFATVGEPPGFAEALAVSGPLPPGARHASSPHEEGVDLVIAFATSRVELLDAWPALTAAVGKHATVWVAWPKKTSGVATDITENTLREDLLPSGWVDVKVCAIDATWSGLKFVLRKELR